MTALAYGTYPFDRDANGGTQVVTRREDTFARVDLTTDRAGPAQLSRQIPLDRGSETPLPDRPQEAKQGTGEFDPRAGPAHFSRAQNEFAIVARVRPITSATVPRMRVGWYLASESSSAAPT